MADFLPNFIRQSGIADPRNYRFLQEAAGNVLSRAVPKNVNWGGLPTGYLNTLDQINKMAPGSAKEAARTAAKNTLTRAAAQPPSQPPIGAAGPGGMLRAPTIGAPTQPTTILSRGPATQIPGSPVQFNPALRRQFGWTGGAQQVANKLIPKPGIGVLKGAGRLAGPIAIGLDMYSTGKQVFNPEDNIITRVQALGTGIGNLLQGRDYLDSTPTGPRQLNTTGGQGRGLRFNRDQTSSLERPTMPGLPDDYKETELRAGEAAERSRPGAGFPGQQGMFTPAAPGTGTTPPAVLDPYAAQNRAYQQERARVEAMVKVNPDMQKQEIADARAKVRDQGMATWAAANPELAKQLQPGQVGYEAVQQALIGNEAGQAARSGYGYQMPQQIMMTPPPGVNTPQGFPAVNSFGATSTYGQQGLQIDPEMEKKFQALLNQTQK